MAENPLDKIKSPRAGVSREPGAPLRKRKDKTPQGLDVDETWKSEEMSPGEELAQQAQDFHAEEEAERVLGRAEGGRDMVPEGSRGSRTERPPAPHRETSSGKKREDGSQASEKYRLLNEAKEKYAKVFGKAFSDRKWYKRILGVNVEKFGEVRQAREAYQRALDEYIKTERESILSDLKIRKISAQEAEMKSKNFAQFIKGDEIATLAQKKQQEAERQSEERGLIITKLSARWNEMMGKWRKLPWYVKVGASVSAFMIGGAGAVAAVGIIRVLNGAVFGKATQEYFQSIADKWEDVEKNALLRQTGKEIDSKIGDAEDRIKRVFGILEKDNEKISEKLTKQAGNELWNRRIGIIAGFIAGTGILAKAVGWGLEYSSGKPSMAGAVVPEGTGRGALSPEIMETRPHGHVINQGDNIWKVTRDIYSENPKGYGYDPSDPKIEKLFQSFSRQGILERMGIDAENFSDLSPEEKIKIWAENKTANSVNKLAELQGGRVRDLVHAGDTVVVKPDGTIVFNEASGIKAGYLSDVQGPKGVADYEPGGKTLEFAPGNQFMKTFDPDNPFAYLMSDGKYYTLKNGVATLYEPGTGGEGYGVLAGSGAEEAAAAAAKAASMDAAQAHKWMDFIQERMYGKGTTVDWNQPAREFRNKFMGAFITSDQPMGPPADIGEQQNLWRAVQEINKRLGPPIGNETTERWLTRGLEQGRISSEDMMRALNRVVNQ